MEVLIDGTPYAPCSISDRIGIGVTTRNRDILATCLANIRKHTPGAKVVVVDDASDTPVESDYRFTENAGIARAKNKCLELLADCEHIFLFDDDCWPKADGWYQPYIDSPEPHLMYIFEDFSTAKTLNDTAVLYRDNEHIAYSHPRGCMLYCSRRVLDVVGGMDAAFGTWGFEHGDWSNRIHAAGLTTHRYCDVAGSSTLIHSMDEHQEATSTVSREQRRQSNQALHDARWDSPEYCEYRQMRDVVIASYFTGIKDDQRNRKWKADAAQVKPLADSLTAELVLITDELEQGHKVTTHLSPYFERWLQLYRYLRDNEDIRYCFAVDATDVVMLNDPFPHMEPNKLYCGSEPKTVGIEWMRNNHPALAEWINTNAAKTLLNAGLVGGDRATVMRIAHDILREYMNARIAGQEMKLDMGPFNHAAYTGGYEIVTGPMVHTLFKANETSSAWWKHK